MAKRIALVRFSSEPAHLSEAGCLVTNLTYMEVVEDMSAQVMLPSTLHTHLTRVLATAKTEKEVFLTDRMTGDNGLERVRDRVYKRV